MEIKVMSFQGALDHIKLGFHVRRLGWNGKGMYIFPVVRWEIMDNFLDQDKCMNQPFLAIKTADNKILPWICSQADMLANDWVVA